MTKRVWIGECPHCHQDIHLALTRYLREQLPGHNFEFTCGACGSLLQVEAVPIPEFEVQLITAGPIGEQEEKDDVDA